MAKRDISDQLFTPPPAADPGDASGVSDFAASLGKALAEEFGEWFSEDGPAKGDAPTLGPDFWATTAQSILDEAKIGAPK